MLVFINYKHGEPLIVTAYNMNELFMKSPIDIKLPVRPFYKEGALYSCTKAKYLKWEDKVIANITKAVGTAFKKELYGDVDIVIEGIKGSGSN